MPIPPVVVYLTNWLKINHMTGTKKVTKMQKRLVCLFACLSSFVLLGQDVVKVAPAGAVKVEYEDAQIRVLRFTEPAGSKLPMHSHPAYVAIGLTADSARYTFPDGKTKTETSKAGAADFAKPVTHSSEDTGNTPSESVMIELKTKPAGVALGDMVKMNPTMCKVELDNAYVRITRVKVPAHGMLKMHTHTSPTAVVYISGGRLKTVSDDGKVSDQDLVPGAAAVRAASKHSNENLSDKPSEAVVVELKTAAR